MDPAAPAPQTCRVPGSFFSHLPHLACLSGPFKRFALLLQDVMDKHSDKHSTHPGFHVFSIRQKPSAEEQRDPNTRQYITRKSHRKSRLGCAACKGKRVKVCHEACLAVDKHSEGRSPLRSQCDEGRPSCGRCSRTKVACDYTSRADVPQISQRQRSAIEPQRRAPQTPPQALVLLKSPSPPIIDVLQRSPRNLNLLRHYADFTGSECDTVTCSDILEASKGAGYRADVLQLAQDVCAPT